MAKLRYDSTESLIPMAFLLRYSGPPGGAVNPGPRMLGRSVSRVTELNLNIVVVISNHLRCQHHVCLWTFASPHLLTRSCASSWIAKTPDTSIGPQTYNIGKLKSSYRHNKVQAPELPKLLTPPSFHKPLALAWLSSSQLAPSSSTSSLPKIFNF